MGRRSRAHDPNRLWNGKRHLDDAETQAVRNAMAALTEVPYDSRGLILCWFCEWCGRKREPGQEGCPCGYVAT